MPDPVTPHAEPPHEAHEHQQPAMQQTVNTGGEPPAMGLTGWLRSLGAISAVTVLCGLYILDRHDARDTFREMISDLKQSAKDDRRTQSDLADRAHQQFQAQTTRQWEAVSKATDATKSAVEEVKKGNAETATQLRALTDEVHKSNIDTQAQLKAVVEEIKKTRMGDKPNGGGGS